MPINLSWNALQRLATAGSVEIDGTTVKIERPVLSALNTIPHRNEDPFVAFYLDTSDPRVRQQ